MTGQLTTRHPADPVATHTHVCVAIDDGRELRYTDARRFGRILLVSEPLIGAFCGRLGTEPLEITLAEFRLCFRSRRARIKALLLDQRVLRGLGNIYADESLFRAKIHPARLAAGLRDQQVAALFRAVREVLTQAINLRGSSISDYVDAEGKRGGFQRRHRVYGREGKGCVRCGKQIRRVIVAGRSSYFCPGCQVVPPKVRARTSKKVMAGKRT